ncbi:MAG: hypothetical protein ACREOC_16410 [Gemmatimonadales bacterium]
MRIRLGVVGAGSVAALLACTDSDRYASQGWHEPLPVLTVELRPPSEAATVWATVEAVPAPEIRFPALLQPDPNHVSPVLAPVTGVLLRIAEEHHARRGEALAVVAQGSEAAGREVTVKGARDGTWRPRRQPRQLVLQDDTLGFLDEHGSWLAVGAVSDIDATFVHRDDPAVVLIEGETDSKHHGRPARVEWVRRPGSASYTHDVAVEFRAPEEGFARGGFAMVVVTPNSPDDSLPAVPASAVAHLPLGPAVFVPVGTGRYEVRWVATGPTVHGMVVVRDRVRVGTPVVSHGLAALVEAARDSLERHTVRP